MDAVKRPSKKELVNLFKIINILKGTPGGLWVREIARQTKMHMETARRIINKYPKIFEEYADFTNYNINLKIIRLKDANITAKNLARFI
ncbi:MAG: hypothetical protein KAT91_01550 [Candidatus Aenigmarchaeota archaeon]|nr:hypothetical protein [Candidatus Aenigmarchaeota archaeon]